MALVAARFAVYLVGLDPIQGHEIKKLDRASSYRQTK
jgi:hypothetical protein